MKQKHKLLCFGCFKLFGWEQDLDQPTSPPAYHNHSCKIKTAKQRQETIPNKCPRLDKIAYKTHEEATQAANRVQQASGFYVNVYRCVCSGLHIGKSSVKIIKKKKTSEQ